MCGEDPCKPSASGPTAKCNAKIQKLIDEGKKQEAIDETIKHYGIDDTKTKEVVYDSSVSGEAAATKSGKVKVGDDAFSSPSWLASSLSHEIEIHVNNQAKKGNWYTGKEGTALQEVEAYDHEISHAKKFGTSKSEIKDLENRRKSHYDQLSPDYKKRADKGDYTMKPGDEAK